ncbi:MAG: FkbM family methyltransferase [Candidatus Polarisedimenticolia bacterium]
MRELPPVIRTIPGILREWSGAVRLAGDFRSLLRLLGDVLLFRVLGLIDLPGRNKERKVTFRDGTRIVYRLNRGDIQSIREVWMERVYRLPVPMRPGLVVDLGANIGLTSLWLARQYGPRRIIAVEPSPENARLVRRNLSLNGVAASVIEAAVGPEDGTALFNSSSDSNMGQLGSQGKPVTMISMASLLREHAAGEPVALMKMDIEGGEQALLTSHTEWLARIPAIVAEFHPDRVDYPGLIERLKAAGFTYLSPASSRDIPMDFFTRPAA